MKRFRCGSINAASWVLVCMVSTTAALHHAVADSSVQNQPELQNASLRVAFDPGAGQLVEFSDPRNGHAFVDDEPDGGLWQIDLLPSSANASITPSEAQAFRWQHSDSRPNEITLTWEGFEAHQAPGMRVVATISLVDEEPVSLWRIAVENAGALQPAAIRFPRVSSIRPQEDEILAAPVWMGEQTSRARELLCGNSSGRRFEWQNPGTMSLQCLALYRRNGPGCYLACDDTAALAKRFAVFGKAGGRIGLELIQLPENRPGRSARYESPYHAVLGAFEGDWFTVAERYRTWALRQSWAHESRLRTGGTADWVAKTGLWVWNRGRSEGVLGPAIALGERAHVPVSVFWHWWHGCAYDVGFPEYLPPREGAASFKRALTEAEEEGIHALVYMNQRLWGMTTASWTEKQAERYAVKGPDGKVRPEVYNTFTRAPCASMCMGTSFWRDTYAGLAEETVKLGVGGIYMDQACSSLACFDETHGHPMGGGDYWMNGFRLLQADIRERCRPLRKVVLAGEGCSEAWLPYLDLMLSLQVSMERYAAPGVWEPIPFFHAVYHGYTVFYGNYSSLTMPPYDELWPPEYAPKEPLKALDRKYSHQFRLEQARAFLWGQQPTIANFREGQFEERAEEVDYVLRLARLRYQALKYLLYGTMLRPPAIETPEETIDMSRLSIYAGQHNALKEYRKGCASVLASAWRAPDGDVAVVLANITGKPQGFTLRLDEAAYPIADASPIYIYDAAGRRRAGQVQEKPVQIPVELQAASACIYAFEPESRTPAVPAD